ncbi:MAG: hypothetical protein ABIA91_00315 [Patescibacteria group bacterium]
MGKKIQFLIFIVAIVVLVIISFVFLTPKTNQINSDLKVSDSFNSDNIDIQIRDMSKVPSEFYSGNSRFSKGLCSQDKDCDAQGCSKEICTSEEGIISTCEVLENAPDKDHYACGCIKDNCGWYLEN